MPRIDASVAAATTPQSRRQTVENAFETAVQASKTKHPEHPETWGFDVPADAETGIQEYLEDHGLTGVASTTFPSANADFMILNHAYHTGEPMKMWMLENPPGGKLKLRVTVTPSGHDGEDKARKYASENTYVGVVGYKDDNGRFQQLARTQFDGNGKETTSRSVNVGKEVWAATSPDMEVDVAQFKKDHPGKSLIVQGWPNFSAGVGGYREGREAHIELA